MMFCRRITGADGGVLSRRRRQQQQQILGVLAGVLGLSEAGRVRVRADVIGHARINM